MNDGWASRYEPGAVAAWRRAKVRRRARAASVQRCGGVATRLAVRPLRHGLVRAMVTGLVALVLPALPMTAAAATAVEYWLPGVGHYFVTALAAETAALDAAAPGGWARTGQAFGVEAASGPGLAPVCRYFSAAFGAKASHFFSADPGECGVLQTSSVWVYEGTVFQVGVPTAGACASGSTPLHRLFNNGLSGAPNHRYTTCAGIRDRMVAQGWTYEGVTMCVAAPSVDCAVDASQGGGVAGAEAFRGNVVLGSPTATSIRANVYAADQSGWVGLVYGTAAGTYERETAPVALLAGRPVEIGLEGLAADTRYYYRVVFRPSLAAAPARGDESSFHTARPPGSTFTFTIQGDSHPERERSQFDPDLYRRTLTTAAADRPDFHVAMGDDFSVDTLDPAMVTAAAVTARYALQRPYFGLIGRSAPVYLVNGNHEQAARYLLDGTPDNVAVWAQNARNAHYSQPASDGFYSGNDEQVPHIGLLRNHYAWTWGDALFVVIDPYWSSPVCVDAPFGGGDKRSNLWDVTHGDAQYRWLKATLEQSTARFKFVFAHHVMGTGRGGIELAGAYEWGGRNGNGAWGFATYRPTWPAPIHPLMVANRVTIFFQGHDHLWARQVLDGVVYQTLPEPADPNYALYNADAYLSGDKFPNTGYARVAVSPTGVKVDYVRTYRPTDEAPGRSSGAAVFSYTVP